MECGDSDSDSDDDSTTTDSKKGSRSKDRRLSETVGIVTSDVDWEAEIAKYRGE